MSKQANTTAATVATIATAADAAVGRRAIEAAKFATSASDRAGRRFVNIALFVGEAIEAGEKGKTLEIRYASINAATGTKRGANSTNPAAVWRTGIEQARQYAPDAMARVGAVTYGPASLTVSIL